MNKTVDFDVFEALLYASAPYAGKKELNEYMTATGAEFNEKSQKRIYRRLSKEQNYYSKHKKYSPVLETFKRVAIIVLVAMSISFTCVLSIDAAREAIWTAIIEWSENFFYFKYTFEDKVIEVPTEILEYKEPTVDERFERYEIGKTINSYHIEYEYQGQYITYSQHLLENFDSYLSNTELVLTEILVNENRGFQAKEIVGAETSYTIVWNDRKYAYILWGNIEYAELLKIAESIE